MAPIVRSLIAFAAVVLIPVSAAAQHASGQVPLPKAPAGVTAPATGIVMHAEYAKAMGRRFYGPTRDVADGRYFPPGLAEASR